MKNNKSEELLKTPLNLLHTDLNARMVPFAGYDMPVQYPTGIRKEHDHTRTSASLFDISHMGQINITGKNVASLLENLVPGEIQGLEEFHQRYSVLTNDNGGILDDLMITRLTDSFLLVVNAACKQQDYRYLSDKLQDTLSIKWMDAALLAVQGPKSQVIMAKFDNKLAEMSFMTARYSSIEGIDCLVHRCGYTGEDGYEISVTSGQAEQLARILLTDDRLMPAGLGARDSLRLEAGLCLYGHDLDISTTPIEADLNWIIAKKYRSASAQQANFPGAVTILSQLKNGAGRIRRGFIPESKMPVREGATIFNSSHEKVGIITSGGYGQSVGKPVCMGYLDVKYDESDDFHVVIRNKKISLNKVSLPFVKHQYYK